jgi:hypothetical protein
MLGFRKVGKDDKPQPAAFLTRLGRDTRGNALAIVAAFIIPVIGMIGSAVDLSRAYLARIRLQQACDAGVLAGRKVMVDSVDSKVTAEVRKFVNFDFPQGYMDTAAFTINPTEGAGEAVDLTLRTTLPPALMQIVGFDKFDIVAQCTARQDFVNTDVMLVLDTTLSMNCLPSENKDTYCPTEKSGSKISGLRSAVLELYRSLRTPQSQLEAAGFRLRYGIVPYSMTVNTGKLLYATNTAWIRNPADYQVCSGRSNGYCSSAGTTRPPARDAAWFTNWAGCIEERQTVTSITESSGYTIPSGAYDLDIDTIPSGDSTKWPPYDPATVTAKQGRAGIDAACPRTALPMGRIADEAAMTAYTSGLTAGGYTYHDIGLAWGARLMSSTGLWSSNNPTTFNNFPVNKHLIFMTDGAMDPDVNAYSAWGVERFSSGGQRVTGNGSETRQYNSHLQRFRMLCNKVKSMNVSVWVVAFGTSSGTGLSTDLTNCASSPAQAFRAADTAALTAKFRQIGESIGALRLAR